VVAFGGKDGYVTVVDRDTHKMLFRTPVTTIEGPYKGPTPEGLRVCPGYAGGVEWNGPALDPLQHTLVTGAVDACFIVKLGTTHYSPTEASFGGTVAQDGPLTGWLTSVDSETGEVRWRYHAEKPVIAGVTPTAGGVTFSGDIAGNFLVFNSKSGELVRKVQTGGALAGGVVTYEAGAKQYVAFASGNVSRLAFGALGLPSVVIMALNPQHPAAAAPAAAPATPPAAGVPGGRKLYSQVCAACHGTDGNLLADHRLSSLKSRRDLASTVSFIKDPKAPMPKLYPDLISEANVRDVAAYLYEELAR
jgi:mono/diheme cytochrome c family protein